MAHFKTDPINFPDNICDRCDQGVPQTAKCIITECDAFTDLIRDIFQTLDHIDLTKVTDHQLGRFISESNYHWFHSEKEPEDPGKTKTYLGQIPWLTIQCPCGQTLPS